MLWSNRDWQVNSVSTCWSHTGLVHGRLGFPDGTVGYMIAGESWKGSSSKLLYCTEATIVALMMQTRLMTASTAPYQDEVATRVVVDEVRDRSVHSDSVLALILAAMQKSPDLRLVLMSATGDHQLVEKPIAYCQRLVMKGV